MRSSNENKIILYTNPHGDNFREINSSGLPFAIIHLHFIFGNRRLFAKKTSVYDILNEQIEISLRGKSGGPATHFFGLNLPR